MSTNINPQCEKCHTWPARGHSNICSKCYRKEITALEREAMLVERRELEETRIFEAKVAQMERQVNIRTDLVDKQAELQKKYKNLQTKLAELAKKKPIIPNVTPAKRAAPPQERPTPTKRATPMERNTPESYTFSREVMEQVMELIGKQIAQSVQKHTTEEQTLSQDKPPVTKNMDLLTEESSYSSDELSEVDVDGDGDKKMGESADNAYEDKIEGVVCDEFSGPGSRTRSLQRNLEEVTDEIALGLAMLDSIEKKRVVDYYSL